jgi:hypothetical protein
MTTYAGSFTGQTTADLVINNAPYVVNITGNITANLTVNSNGTVSGTADATYILVASSTLVGEPGFTWGGTQDNLPITGTINDIQATYNDGTVTAIFNGALSSDDAQIIGTSFAILSNPIELVIAVAPATIPIDLTLPDAFNSETIGSGALVWVPPGQSVSSVTVLSGGTLIVDGIANGTSDSGTLNVYGTVNGVVDSGLVDLYSGGTLNNITVEFGDKVFGYLNGAVALELLGGETGGSLPAVESQITDSQGHIQITNGNIGGSSEFSDVALGANTSIGEPPQPPTGQLVLNSGASAVGMTIESGGVETVTSGGSSTATSLQSGSVTVAGGFVEFATGANSGTVTFSAGGEIKLDQPANFSATIGNLASGDIIDLANTNVAGVHIFGSSLDVTETNGASFALALQNPGFVSLAIQSDGNGGSELIAMPGTPTDMVMRDASNGDFEIYDIGANTILSAASLGQVGQSWQIAGFGAFSGANSTDMIQRNGSNGQFEIYDIIDNSITFAAGMGQVGLEWQVAGFGDFSSRANETDMLMRNGNTGQFEIYDIGNNAITSAASMGQVGMEWQVAGFGDFSTRPNETDILMRNGTTGAFEVYDIENNAITFAAGMGKVGQEWQVAGFGDFSGNANETDMLMRNSATGAFEVYDIENNTITFAASMGQVGPEWQVAGFGNFSGNANETDMLMRDSATGAFEVYDIENNAIQFAASMGQVGPEWQVGGFIGSPAVSNSLTVGVTQAIASFAADALVDTNLPVVGAVTPSAVANPLSASNGLHP